MYWVLRCYPARCETRYETAQALAQHFAGIFARHRKGAFADQFGADIMLPQYRIDVLLEVIGLSFFDQQDRLLASSKRYHFLVDQRIGHIELIDREAGFTKGIRKSQPFHGADQCVVQAALNDDTEFI